MIDREKVIAWLTEISLRPCDFATDDFDAYETEHLANEALEICEDAKVFNQQRNDAIAQLKDQEHKDRMFHALEDDWKRLKGLLKEQEAVEPLPQNSNGWLRTITLWYCGACHSKISRRTSKYCPNCGKPILWEGR